jgi:hypothetical protein
MIKGIIKGSSKLVPYVNSEHISNIYKYYNNNVSGAQPYKNNDKKQLIKGISKKGSLDSSINNSKLPIIPNRKLSPIRRHIKV